VERLLCAERKFNHSKAPNWQTTGENRLVICFRILNCLIILQAVKTSSFPCLFIMFQSESNKRIMEIASYLEITDVLDKFPSQMSGGQKQRVAAARAVILNPSIILADEPTGALDSKNAKLLMKKLSGLNQEYNATILMVTHDCNAASYCKRICSFRTE